MLMFRITEIAPSTSSIPPSLFVLQSNLVGTNTKVPGTACGLGVYFCCNYHAGENMFGLFYLNQTYLQTWLPRVEPLRNSRTIVAKN